MKFTKKRLNQIVKEEYEKLKNEGLISESFRNNDMAPMSHLPNLYSNRVQAARRGNRLPPDDSNWYRFSKHLDLGVLDLDKLAIKLGYKSFDHMDAAVSPRGLDEFAVEKVADILYDDFMIDDIDVYDALEA